MHGGQTTCFNLTVNALLLSLAALNCCNLLVLCPSIATLKYDAKPPSKAVGVNLM